MVYRDANLLIFPTLSTLLLGGLAYIRFLPWTRAVAYECAALVVYALLAAITLGVFARPHPKVVERGPMTYYYRAYQEPYHTAAARANAIFSRKEHKVIAQNAQFFGVYWDNPRSLENPNMCRSLIGFVLSAKATPEAVDIFEKAGLLKIRLQRWTAVEASMRAIFMATYAVAPMKLIAPVCAYVAREFPERFGAAPMYELCNGNYTAYGYVVSEEQKTFSALEPFPPPKLSAFGEAEFNRKFGKIKAH